MQKIYLLIAFFAVLFISSCDKKTDTAGADFDQTAMLTNLSANVIQPALLDWQNKNNALTTAVTSFTTNPTLAGLTEAQNAFKAAYLSYSRICFYEFGPGEEKKLRESVNTFPVNTARIETNLQLTTIDFSLTENKAARGYPAVDFLLYTYLENYTGANAAGYKNYLTALTADLKSQSDYLVSAWQNGYATTFNSAKGSDANSSLSLLVNQLSYECDFNKGPRVGIPGGMKTLGTPQPDKVEALKGGFSVELLKANIEAQRSFYNGGVLNEPVTAKSPTLRGYLKALEAKYNGQPLDETIDAQYGALLAKVNALPNGRLSDLVIQNVDEVKAVYNENQKLLVLLKTDLSSAFSVLIAYGDSDGD